VPLASPPRWINAVRSPRETIPAYSAKHFAADTHTTVYAMYPGDRLVDGVFEPLSPYRAQLRNGRLDPFIDFQYPQAVSAFSIASGACAGSIDPWAARLASHLDSQIKFHSPRALTGIRFALRFT